ncbi:hypothetical protein GOV14_01815 [Candidatus Pacearchaeota archaeon]|nr:hypothetical protein [Candidatus Pacearchaeota archaeon]
MAITEDELKKLIEVAAFIEKVSTLSSDGKNLLLRVPKEIRSFLTLSKGDKLRWLVKDKKSIHLEVIKKDADSKKAKS